VSEITSGYSEYLQTFFRRVVTSFYAATQLSYLKSFTQQ